MKSQPAKELRRRLRALRAKHALTQEAFTEIAGLNLKHYQEIEGGRKNDLRLSTIERISRAYGIKVFELFAPKDPPSRIGKRRTNSPHYRRRATAPAR